MKALDRLDSLPDWPARMTAPVAAAYMGVSQTTFLARFAGCGVKEGGNTLWARAQLDAHIARQFGLIPAPVAPGVDDPYEEWKRTRGG